MRAFIALVLASLLLPAGRPAPAHALDTPATLIASADGYVRSSRPSGNYGLATTLRVRLASDTYTGYVKFDVQGLTAAPSSAILRLFVTDGSPDGGAIWAVTGNWSDTSLTAATAPTYAGSPVADLGKVTAGVWVEADVSAVVSGNGTYGFAIGPQSGNSAVYSSREGAQPPQLVLNGGGSPPPPGAPTASFTASPTSGTAPLSVAFTDTSTGAPTAWAWDFDANGTTDSTSQNPNYSYPVAGTYSVKLTASNAGGSNSLTRTDLITVSAEPPPPPGGGVTVAPVADAYVSQGRPTSNYGPATTLRVRLDTDSYASLLKFTVSDLTAAPSSAVLRLYVVDGSPSGGRVSTTADTWSETTVTWASRPLPIVTIGDIGAATTGTWATIDVTSVVSGNGSYAFYIAGLSSNSVVYSSREGVQSAQLVLNEGGAPPPAPTASFTAAPSGGGAPLTVSFTDTSTGSPTSWAWDFDANGTTDDTARNPSFTYTTPGTYSVQLTVGNAGGTDSLTQTNLITVSDPPPPDPNAAVLVGAGDIAKCTSTNDEATARLVEAIAGTVFTAGDNVYEDGTASEFANCYDPSWGRFKSRTRPVVGNHEYQTPGATGYYGYFGAAAGDPTKGYYSFDVGSWHIVALNSECSIVSCSAGSAQEQWLRADLVSHPSACTMAIFHRPLFSSSTVTGSTSVRPLWQALYDNNAEVVVNGHAHIYERFAPQRPDATSDPTRGLRQFIVGTGGAALNAIGTPKPNSEVRNNQSFGVMQFTLHAAGYDWQFVPAPGSTLNDSGSGTCH